MKKTHFKKKDKKKNCGCTLFNAVGKRGKKKSGAQHNLFNSTLLKAFSGPNEPPNKQVSGNTGALPAFFCAAARYMSGWSWRRGGYCECVCVCVRAIHSPLMLGEQRPGPALLCDRCPPPPPTPSSTSTSTSSSSSTSSCLFLPLRPLFLLKPSFVFIFVGISAPSSFSPPNES